MKLCFLTCQFQRYPLETSFQMAEKYGFQGVEIWGGRPHAYPYDMDAALVGSILAWKKQYHVEVPVYTPEQLGYPYNLASRSLKEREETVAYLKHAVRVCAQIECPRILLTCGHPGYGRDADAVWNDLVEGLQEICGEANACGVRVVMEALGPNESPVLVRTDDLVRLLAGVRDDCLEFMLDVAIPPLVGEPVSEYFEKAPGKCAHVHLCGCDPDSEFHMQVAEGSGSLSLQSVLKVLRRFGYDGWYSVEILYPYFRDPELFLAESAEYLAGLA